MTNAGTMEFTVAGYLIGFSLGQLLWAPLGDRYGRRGPVAVGPLLFVIGSAVGAGGAFVTGSDFLMDGGVTATY